MDHGRNVDEKGHPAEQSQHESAQPQVTESNRVDSIGDVDYSKFDSPELRQSIESILSVGRTLNLQLLVIVLAFPIGLILIVRTFWDKGWMPAAASVLVGPFVSMSLAMLLAITLSARRILNETVIVIDRTLDIVANILGDVGASRDEGLATTTASIFGGVSRNLVLPIAENVVRAQLGPFGRPLLWLYRRIFARAVDFTTTAILSAAGCVLASDESDTDVSHQDVSDADASQDDVSGSAVGNKIAAGVENADAFLQSIRSFVVGGSHKLMAAVLLPLWAVFIGSLLATVLALWFAHRML